MDDEKKRDEELLDLAQKDRDRCKKLIDAIDNLKRISGKLPKVGGGYELCVSYPGFTRVVAACRTRVHATMVELFHNAGCKIQFPKEMDDLSKLIDANHFLDEKITLAIDHHLAEIRGEKLTVPTLEKTAASHMGNEKVVFANTPFGKDSSGRYQRLGKEPKIDDLTTLLHRGLHVAKNLPKPQLKFQGCINNADEPFAPKLRVKHHSKVRTEGNIKIIDDDMNGKEWNSDSASYEHPYDYELQTFVIPNSQKERTEPKIFKKLEDVPCILISTKEELANLVQKLNSVKIFAVDLEHHSYRTFLGLTSLMQITVEGEDYIIDPFPIWADMGILNEPFTNPEILKVFHGAEEDIKWLQRDFGIYVVNMFDTHIAMKTLKMSRLSLQYLVEHFCGITLGKELQKADWRIRPLSLAHLTYARSDTHYLIYCYEKLRNQLIDHGMDLLETVYNNSAFVCLKTYQPPRFNELGYLKLISHRRPTNQQIYALKKLWQWRDQTAREEDESLDYVLPDQMLLQIAEVLPREKQGIISCCSPVPVFLKRDILILHRIMIEARDIPLDRSGAVDVADPTSLSRNAIDVAEKSPFEQRLEELFNCDCNVELTEEHEEMEVENVDLPGLERDMVFVIKSKNEEKSKEYEEILNATNEWVTPYEAYQIAIMNSEKLKSDKKETEKDKPKMFSHHDPSTKKTIIKPSEKANDEEEDIPILMKTKSAQKRKLQYLKNQVDVPLAGRHPVKRGKTDSAKEKEPEKGSFIPDYGNIDASKFDQPADTSGVYNPHQRAPNRRGSRGRGRGGRGRSRGRRGR